MVEPAERGLIDFHGARVGAFVSGRTTYEHADRWGGDSPKAGVPLFVLGREPIPDADPRQTIVTDGIESAVERAKAVAGEAGKDVAVMSGTTVTEALEAGLPDEIVINQRPVLLGGGHPFFRELPDAVHLECMSVAVNADVVHLTYRVLR